MNKSPKNSPPFSFSFKPNSGDILSCSFENYPKPQISDLAVLAAYPFGSVLSSVSKGEYSYGFQNWEKDDEIKGSGNHLSFGDYGYDPRLGRRWNIDPLASKYPDLSPYHFTGNNPIRFVDFDGEDFGVKINHTDKTIVIVANVYTTSAKAYRQALKSAGAWNTKSATSGGYTVTFQMKVNKPVTVSESEVVGAFGTVDFYRKNGKLKKNLYSKYESALVRNKTLEAAESDPIGNSYAGNNGLNSRNVSGSTFTGGQTMNGRHADMNTHDERGDMGESEGPVTHEFGHFFGLDDKGGTYYPGDGGIMQYTWPMNSISDGDVNAILNYAKDYLGGKVSGSTESKVTLLENTGSSDGSNPIGVTNKVEDE
jgi:RHS repeat-associated protein